MRRNTPAERTELPQDASPQVGRGHGHTEISNELLEAVCRFPFTGPQLRLLMFVIRDSYGWKRKIAKPRVLSEWAKALEMPKTTIHRTIRELHSLGILETDLHTGGLAPVKNYNAWGNVPQLPFLELSTTCEQPVDNSVSTVGVPLAERSKYGNPTGGTKRSTGGTKNPASGTPYGEINVKKKERGTNVSPGPQLLPNGKNDTPTNRADLGDWEYAPQDHPGFGRLSFKLQDSLTDQWRERGEAQRKRNACRKCQGSPRANEAWAYCRECTVCSRCEAFTGHGVVFHLDGTEILCNECKEGRE